jgi:hypothetical protein
MSQKRSEPSNSQVWVQSITITTTCSVRILYQTVFHQIRSSHKGSQELKEQHLSPQHAGDFLQKMTKEQLELNRSQLRWVTRRLIWHCQLKGHLFKLWLTNKLNCKGCLNGDETHSHILCDCEALWLLRCTTILHSKCRTLRSLTRRGYSVQATLAHTSFIHSIISCWNLNSFYGSSK